MKIGQKDEMPAMLLPHHLQELKDSGLTDEMIKASGIESVPAEIATLYLGYPETSGGWAAPFHEEGEPPYWTVKLDVVKDGKNKYRVPKGRSHRL